MNQKEMVDRCKEKGFNVSAPLLYRQGKKNGFLVENRRSGRERYKVDEEKFNNWLSKIQVEEGWVAVGEAARSHKMTYSALIYQLNKNHSVVEKKGIVRGGVQYARREDVERAVASYNRRVEE